MIILASGSPRRKEILNNHSINPRIIKPETDEIIPSGFYDELTVNQAVMYLALKKGRAVYRDLSDDNRDNSKFIISADTVVFEGRIIGKPNTRQEAFEILDSLRGKAHKVLTGVAIIDVHKKNTEILCDVSTVHFKYYSDTEIYDYIDSEQPYDKAGAYAIQSAWGEKVDHIDGDLENVIGLPWDRIAPIILK